MLTESMSYEPKDPQVARIWRRLSPAAREKRFSQAMRRQEVIRALANKSEDVSERTAVSQLNAGVDRTTIRSWRKRYENRGFDGLIDIRIRPDSPIEPAVCGAICTLRRADPNISVKAVIAHVKQYHGVTIGETSVEGLLRKNGLSRPRGAPPGTKRQAAEQRLTFGGMKLLEAAIVETGYVDGLSEAIAAHVENLPRPESAKKPDTSGRDHNGQFLADHNERYRKGPQDSIGPGFASVSQKREGMDVDRMEIAKVSQDVIARKLTAVLVSPLAGGGRWDGMRTPQAGILLNEVCDHPYMPATLDRFTRELKYAGVASTLWEIHARFALKQSQRWGDGGCRRDAVLYVDGTSKPIWTKLFSQATRVSMLGRTMPGLEVVAFHSGYGVPLWMLTYSGRAPLVNVVSEAIDRLDEICGSSSVGRVVVIDAEANSIPFLRRLEQGTHARAWVTRLRDEWVRDRKIFNRNNYRPYRNGDRVRMGVADFNDPETKGAKFRMRVVEVDRRTSGKVTCLGASMLLDTREWDAASLADLYFDRWPSQEADFRAVNQAAGFKEVHGYGRQLVDNVSVVTKLDELAQKSSVARQRYIRQESALEVCRQKVREEKKLIGRLARRQDTVNRHLEADLVVGQTVTASVQSLANEQRSLNTEIAKRNKQLEKRQTSCDKAKSQSDRTKGRLNGYRQRQKTLESRRKIFAHDVELDSLFSLLNVGLVLMVTYVLREYLGHAKMDALTFLDRVATLPARQSFTQDLETITFAYNQRDPDVMALLEEFSQTINDRGLRMRTGRNLRILVDPAPLPLRAHPCKNWCKSKTRFKR
ncbi:MAG: helix-turn-helix domain-containing protein [Planctomycetaceae bacterium]|nr:helix-turn-helix domain-containing protein [Planctomycetaceae bacterium]